MSRFRLAMDIGGTFTDVVAYDEETGTYTAGKYSTTPAELTEGVLSALTTIEAEPEQCSFAVHGTTRASTRSCSAAARRCCFWRPGRR